MEPMPLKWVSSTKESKWCPCRGLRIFRCIHRKISWCIRAQSRWKTSLAVPKTSSYLFGSNQWHWSLRSKVWRSFNAWYSTTRSSLEERWDWARNGEKIWWRPSMTIATRLRTRLLAPTSSTFSSRRASHGRSRSLFATIEALGSTECSSVSLFLKDLVSSHRTCQWFQSWSVLSTNFLERTRSIELSTNLIESNAHHAIIKKVKRRPGRHGSTKTRCRGNPILAPFSWSVREIRSNSRSLFRIWMVSSSGSNGNPSASQRHQMHLPWHMTKTGRKGYFLSTALRKFIAIWTACACWKMRSWSGTRLSTIRGASSSTWHSSMECLTS